MELLLIINSCRLASADSITVITPYFPYSKGWFKAFISCENTLLISRRSEIQFEVSNNSQTTCQYDTESRSTSFDDVGCSFSTIGRLLWSSCWLPQGYTISCIHNIVPKVQSTFSPQCFQKSRLQFAVLSLICNIFLILIFILS